MSISPVRVFSGVKKNISGVSKKFKPSKILEGAKKSKPVKDAVQKAVPVARAFDPVQIIAGVLLGATGMGLPTVVAMNSYPQLEESPKKMGRVYSTTA